jgi:hypothetical protein
MLLAWSSVLIRWAYTVSVVVTFAWPMNLLISSARWIAKSGYRRFGS